MVRLATTYNFVGTISLGLLTGVSYTLATTTLPSLLSLRSASHALPAFLTLQTGAKFHLRLLTAIAATSLTLAHVLAPPSGRHPYLLWTSLVAAAGGGVDYFLRHDEDALREEASSGSPAEKSWIDVEQGEDVNGEVVRTSMERFTLAETVRTGVSGVAFAMAVVGLWGDCA